MCTLLVIGGTGFFGKSILDSFKRGLLDDWGIDRVIAMSRNTDQLRHEAPMLIDDRVELLNADIRNADWLPSAEYVVHAAASTDVSNYIHRPEVERQNIEEGISNYCRLAPKYHSSSKIVYISSGAVYGIQPAGIETIDENYEAGDLSILPVGKREYAIAKRNAENAFMALGDINLEVSIARCFAFVGPWLPRKQNFAIGNFIEDGLRGRPIAVKANYPVYRSYMHADDLVKWLMTIAENADKKCEAYNVGSDVAVSIEELARLVAIQFGAEASVQIVNQEKIDRYVPDITKATRKLGLKINIGLLESIRNTINVVRCLNGLKGRKVK